MASPKIEAVLKNCCSTCGEGPHWDVASQSLYYVDIVCGGVARWNSLTGETKRVDLNGECGFVIPCDRGGCVVGNNQDICHLDLETSALTKLVSVENGMNTRFNDAKCDASGRLWAGTMGNEGSVPGVVEKGQGSLYSVDSGHKVKKHVGGIDISNGMDWTDDNTVMYYIDSVPRKVYAFDFDIKEGSVSNQRTVVEFGDMATYGLPDGMCIDCEGKIWVACFSSSKVHRFDPETGKTLQTLEFPATNITSVCFGGKNLDELYVTCSRHNVPETSLSNQPLAGSIFKVTGLGVKGRAPNNFKG